jgi:hypothetical protein
MSGPLHEFGASLCWNLDFEKSKKLSKFRLKFCKSIRRQNGMVLKACSLIKRPPTGQVGLSAKRSPGLRLFLFCLYFFLYSWLGSGGGFYPGWAQKVHCIGGEQDSGNDASVVASPRCYPTRCMGLRMFVTNTLQNRPRPDRSRRTARGTLAS